jgi:general secretion pathway protein D
MRWLMVLVILVFSLTLKLHAQEKTEGQVPQQKDKYVTIDFQDVDINVLIKFISEITGKNFIVDKNVKGTVTIISPTKITVDEAYKVFESVLEVHGFAAIPSGNVTKIVPSVEARTKAIDVYMPDVRVRPEDKLVTQLIRLKYADPEEIRKVFTPFVSKTGMMASYKPTNMLIIIDTLSNINRILDIIHRLDVEGIGRQIAVIPLKYASANYLSKVLGNIFKPQMTAPKAPPAGQQQAAPIVEAEILIIPEERLNLLIVLATESDLKRVQELVQMLDSEAPRGEGNIRVYYLQYASADEILSVLTAIPRKPTSPTPTGATQQAQQAQHTAAPGPTGQAVISKDVSISADKATNSLIIAANKEDYQVIEDVIKKLDIPRMMVYLEALIMEVSATKEFSLGVDWQAGDQIGTYKGNRVGALGGASFGNLGEFASSVIKGGTLPRGFSLGIISEGISLSVGGRTISFPNIGAVVRALEGDSDINILSTPQLLTLDNQEAEIKVGKNVPYLTKGETTQTTTGIQYVTYEYRDVGVNLKITPQINRDRLVRLKIYQELSQLAQGSETDKPTTLKRSFNTTVAVRDGQTIVIGGLIDTSLNAAESSVPCLGGVPGLGWFFKSVSRTTGKTNLFVFLTPHIIENVQEADKILEEKRSHMDRLKEGSIKLYPGEGTLFPEQEETPGTKERE